ncbi:MAG: glycosyltransferase family 4 protein [Verrucomicrobia bacterium]|nr:MAG: glycosyltransferase family 4 protein [Verrucomicrobiota bacterium]
MQRPIVIVSPLLPPMQGGLADHTLGLARHLSGDFKVSVLSSRDVYTDGPVPIRAAVHDWEDVSELEIELSATPRDSVLLWQYVPHMYGRGGVNRGLPELWRSLEADGRRQVILTHEIAAPWGRRPNQWWYAWNHRRQWNAAMKVADLLPISTEAWTLEWRRRRPDAAGKMFAMASPTSIEPVAVDPGHRERWRVAHGLPADIRILAWWGSVEASKQLEWVLEAWQAACRRWGPVALCIAGGHPALPLPGALRSWSRILGYLKPGEVSACLHAADVLALPYVDGASERRTTLMAGLAHGVPIATTLGSNSGPTMSKADWLVASDVTERGAFVDNVLALLSDEARRKTVGAAGKVHHDAEYSWDVVARTLGNRMRESGITEP